MNKPDGIWNRCIRRVLLGLLALITLWSSSLYCATVSEFPADFQLYPRDNVTNLASVHVVGKAQGRETDISLQIFRNGRLQETRTHSVATSLEFSFVVKIPAELFSYEFKLLATQENSEQQLVASASNVVAGDAFFINGQSNAVSTAYSTSYGVDVDGFVRTFGGWGRDSWEQNQDWSIAQRDCVHRPGCIGQLGLRFGKQIVEAEQIPVAIINGARGGRPIKYFQRDDANSTNIANNYGRLLTRLTLAGLTGGIRAIIWYQGESDGADVNSHIDGFTQLHADWNEDYPSVERIFAFQIRNGCGPQLSETSDAQRQFARRTESIIAVSTTGLDGHDGCHYRYIDGYQKMGDNLARIVRGDLYDRTLKNSDAPDIVSATLIDSMTIELVFTADNELIADDGFESLFQLRNVANNQIIGISTAMVVEHSKVRLTTSQPIPFNPEVDLSYISPMGNQNWLTNSAGIGIQTFFHVPVTSAL